MLLQNTKIEKDLDNLSLNEEIQLITLAKTNLKYKEIVYNNCKKLIKAIANKYIRGDTVSEHDLMQEGFFGVDRAIDDYNPDRKKRFSTYARWWITSFIVQYYRANARGFRISGSLSGKLNDLLKINLQLDQKLGRSPTVKEISKASGIEEGHINYLRRFLHTVDRPIHLAYNQAEDNGEPIENVLPDNHSDSPVERLIRTDSIQALRNALNSLSEVDRFILTKRYELDGEDKLTLEETGEKMVELPGGKKLTAERVRQLQVLAEARLKKLLNK